MTLFHYKAQIADGTIVDGEAEANDQFELARKMKAEGKTVVFAESVKHRRFPLWDYVNGVLGSVHLKDKVFFMRNLGVMVGAGLPLVRSLSILKRQTKNGAFQKVLTALEESITKGKSLNESLQEFPKVFSALTVAMVKSGEASGTLVESLRIIARHLEESYILQKRVQGALIYPAVIITAMVGIGVAMMVYVVPTLTSTFVDLGVPLPFLTQLIILISDSLRDNGLAVLGGLVIAGFSIFYILRTESGKRAIDFLFLKAPFLGAFTQKLNSARTARTLSSLLSSGVTMLEAVSITREVIQNTYYKEVLAEVEEKIQKGVSLSEIFSLHEDTYSILVGEMIAVGEETGKLSGMLEEIAKFYESEIEQTTKNLNTVIEPILMIILGGAVGVFAYAMITPLYSVLGGI